MLIFPQLTSGALSQFPIEKRRRKRTIVNELDDGSLVKLDDPAAQTTEWSVHYAGLSDIELAAIQQFFADAEGSLQSFTFLDPAGNLFAWSDDFFNDQWHLDPMIRASCFVDDPAGDIDAWHLTNIGGAAQSISQSLPAAGDYLFTFSAYVRPSAAVTLTALIGTSRGERPVSAGTWSRISFTSNGAAGTASTLFGLELPAGAQVDVYGMQVEPQSAPSPYKQSSDSGVFENARLADDELRFTTTGPNSHSATVNFIHASHL